MMRSGRPRSSISTIRPPASMARHSRPDSGARRLYTGWPKTEPMDATLSTPEAATIMKMAKTCGRPHTTWLVMPVTTWPWISM